MADPEVVPMAERRRFTAEEKLRILEEADDCTEPGEIGAQSGAQGRIVADPDEVLRRKPDIIIGSWCGKKFRPEQVAERPGWERVPAVRDGQLHEIKSADILQPGPAALTDGVRQLHGRFPR